MINDLGKPHSLKIRHFFSFISTVGEFREMILKVFFGLTVLAMRSFPDEISLIGSLVGVPRLRSLCCQNLEGVLFIKCERDRGRPLRNIF